MALTWGILLVGGVALFGLPPAIWILNARKRHAGWWLLLGVISFVIVGNAIEKALTGSSPIF